MNYEAKLVNISNTNKYHAVYTCQGRGRVCVLKMGNGNRCLWVAPINLYIFLITLDARYTCVCSVHRLSELCFFVGFVFFPDGKVFF